jgi:hypothetical protein
MTLRLFSTRMKVKFLFVAASIGLLALLSYFVFPGYEYWSGDTSLYVAMLEHLRDPTILAQDIVAQRPHLAFTIYDEVTLGLRQLTGLGFEGILNSETLILRASAITGVYLLATTLKLSSRMALLVAAFFSLGGQIIGPSVAILDLEPVPRAFAVCLLFFAIGLVARGRYLVASIAASIAFLYHPPTVYPFWAAYLCLSLWLAERAIRRSLILGFIPLICAIIALLLSSRWQPGIAETQAFFSRVDPSLESLQRMRTMDVYVSTWNPRWWLHYSFLWLVSLQAFWRLREFIPQRLRFFLIGLPLIGILSMPGSYLLLDRLKWSLIPQVQPARALLLVTALAGILATAAAVKAAEKKKYIETLIWLGLVFVTRVHIFVWDCITGLANPLGRKRDLILLILAVGAGIVAISQKRRQRWVMVAWAASIIAPFLLINYANLDYNRPYTSSPQLTEVSEWARSMTSKDAVFLFPDSDIGAWPSIFRAQALRAVYVDWKGGGQINFFKGFAEEWGSRWRQTMNTKTGPVTLDRYAPLGIDYLVVQTANTISGKRPVFANSRFIIYRIEREQSGLGATSSRAIH